jgi:hypothetical protein
MAVLRAAREFGFSASDAPGWKYICRNILRRVPGRRFIPEEVERFFALVCYGLIMPGSVDSNRHHP